jgi:hypothetical protein
LDGREISLKKKQLGYELMSYLGFFLMLRGFVLASIFCFFSQNKTFFKTTGNPLEKSFKKKLARQSFPSKKNRHVLGGVCCI